jgi:HlyD family secretion protein
MRFALVLLVPLLLSACDSDNPGIALGTLERDRIALTATASEVVTQRPVKPGSQIEKGQLLLQLDDRLQKAQVSKAEAEVAQAKASLQKLRRGARAEEIAVAKAKVDGARAALVVSKANYQRALDLKQQNLTSDSTLDEALAKRDASLANLQSAEEQLLLLTNGARKEDIQIAEARLDAAQAVLLSAQKQLADLTIRATRSGILDDLPWNLGERVTRGSPLAIVLAGKAPYARVYIPEPYRVKLSPGDHLIIHIDGLDHPVSGRLRWISTQPAFTPYYALNQQERARLMYLAKIQLPDSEAALPNGIPVQVELP